MHRASGNFAAVQWWPYCAVLWVWQARPQGAADWALWRGRCLCAPAAGAESALGGASYRKVGALCRKCHQLTWAAVGALGYPRSARVSRRTPRPVCVRSIKEGDKVQRLYRLCLVEWPDHMPGSDAAPAVATTPLPASGTRNWFSQGICSSWAMLTGAVGCFQRLGGPV